MVKFLIKYNEFLEIILVSSPNGKSKIYYECQLLVPKDGIYLFVNVRLQVKSEKASIGLVSMYRKGTLLHTHRSLVLFVGKTKIVEAYEIRKVVKKETHNG